MKCLYYLILCLVLISAGSACKTSGHARTGDSPAGTREAGKIYSALVEADQYTWYTGKARVKANTPDMRVSGSLQLRMLRDSAIWAVIDKFGFEIARVLILPDSVFIVDRLNKEYTSESLGRFLDEYGVQVSFRDLQSTLAGRMIALEPRELKLQKEDGNEVLTIYDRNGVSARHWVAASNPPRLLRSAFVDIQGRKLEIENMDWSERKGVLFPFERFLVFEDADGRTEIEMDFSEITLDQPAEMPFSIPSHYARSR